MCTKLTVTIESQNYPPFWHAFRTHAGDCKANISDKYPPLGLSAVSKALHFLEKTFHSKLSPKCFWSLTMARKPQRYITVKKTAMIFFISTGIFASEPMTLPEIEHVSFLVEHAQTFFAGEGFSKLFDWSNPVRPNRWSLVGAHKCVFWGTSGIHFVSPLIQPLYQRLDWRTPNRSKLPSICEWYKDL